MADTGSTWSQHIDRIAYGVATVLGLIVLAVPFLFSGSVDSTDLDRLIYTLEEKAEEQKAKMQPSTPENLGALVRGHWSTGKPSRDEVPWVTERPPLFLKLVKKGQGEPANHLPARLSEILCERDAKKQQVFLRVKGFLNPENQYVKIRKIMIRRSVDSGSFKLVGTVDIFEEFAYEDYDVEPGKTYSYKVITQAKADPDAPEDVNFSALTERQESEPLGPTEKVPPDYSLVIAAFDAKVVEKPRVMAKLWYWDYKKGKLFSKPSPTFYAEKQKFGSGKRWQFFQIHPSKGKVLIADKKKLGKDTVTEKAKRVPVDVWEPLSAAEPEVPADEEGGEGFDDMEVNEVIEEEVQPEPSPKKSKRKRKGFRRK